MIIQIKLRFKDYIPTNLQGDLEAALGLHKSAFSRESGTLTFDVEYTAYLRQWISLWLEKTLVPEGEILSIKIERNEQVRKS